jgi:ribose 5-phosphate isomerase B
MDKREFLNKAGLLTTSFIGLPFIRTADGTYLNRLKELNKESMTKVPPGNLVIGGDHAGFPLKGPLIEILITWGYNVKDVGCFSPDPVDFPDIALLLVNEILKGQVERGIMVCGTGVGASIACNKIRGIRAALCHDTYSAHQCVEHDNVNVLCLGAQIIGLKLAGEIIHNFLNAQFSTEEQFRRRVNKLDEFDKLYPINK